MLSTIWNNFSAFWTAYGPWIGTALLPAIITGLTLSPKTEGAVGVVQKIWNGLKMVMDFLSVLSHKDKPGTFQLPLKAGVVVAKMVKKPEGPATLLLVFFFASSQVNCSWWSSGGKTKVKTVAIDCTLSAVMENASALLPAVLGIVQGGTPSWKDQFKTLGKEFGRDASACALRAALEELDHPVQSEPEGDPEVLRLQAAARARALILESEFTYVE